MAHPWVLKIPTTNCLAGRLKRLNSETWHSHDDLIDLQPRSTGDERDGDERGARISLTMKVGQLFHDV